MRLLRKQIAATSLLYLVLCLPLVTVIGSAAATSVLRAWVLLTASALLIFISSSRQVILKNYRSLNRPVKILLLLLLATIIFSSLKPAVFNTKITFLGEGFEHLGLLFWLCFLTLFVYSQKYIRAFIFSKTLLYATTLIGLLSLISDQFYIRHGLRVAGLLYHPTSMSIFASLAVIIAYNTLLFTKQRNLRVVALISVLANVTIIVLTQSRIGVAALLLVLAINGLLLIKTKQHRFALATIAMTITLLVLPFAFKDFFIRFRQESIARGSSYRINLYKTAAQDIFKNNLFLGNGPSTIPPYLNDKNKVPEDVAATLNLGYTFSSSHNLFFDLAYYFGALSMFALFGLLLLGIKAYVLAYKLTPERVNFGLIFGVLLLNAFVNIPSVEMTSLLFIVAAGLFAGKDIYKNDKTA